MAGIQRRLAVMEYPARLRWLQVLLNPRAGPVRSVWIFQNAGVILEDLRFLTIRASDPKLFDRMCAAARQGGSTPSAPRPGDC